MKLVEIIVATLETKIVQTMKIIKWIVIIAAPFAIGTNLSAQSTPVLTGNDLERAKIRLELERDAIFMDALHLSISQASSFLPIYQEYTRDRNELDERLIRLMVLYLEKYQSGDKKFMHEFIAQSRSYQREEEKLRQKYFKKINKAVSLQVASEFYELDDFCCAVLRLNILSSLPFTAGFIQK